MTATKPLNLDHIFRVFKYTIYAVLALNILLFFQEESLATAQTFSQGINLKQIIHGFAATIDTAAWLVLLLIFELETAILADATLRKPRVQGALVCLRLLSYGLIIYALYGYFNKMLMTYNVVPFAAADLCALVGQGYTTILTLDEYPLLDTQSCARLADQTLFQLNGQKILGSLTDWVGIQWLAWVEVINSITWLAVVVILEVDVWLQLRGRTVYLSKIIKVLLYSILLAAATYWGFLGDFLDFWDAFVWLVAFVFIEMNLFQWQTETTAPS